MTFSARQVIYLFIRCVLTILKWDWWTVSAPVYGATGSVAVICDGNILDGWKLLKWMGGVGKRKLKPNPTLNQVPGTHIENSILVLLIGSKMWNHCSASIQIPTHQVCCDYFYSSLLLHMYLYAHVCSFYKWVAAYSYIMVWLHLYWMFTYCKCGHYTNSKIPN